MLSKISNISFECWKKINASEKRKKENGNLNLWIFGRENDVEKRTQWFQLKRKTWYLYSRRLCKHCGLFALSVYTFTFVSEKFRLPYAYLSLHRSIWHCGLPWRWSWCLKNGSHKQILWLPLSEMTWFNLNQLKSIFHCHLKSEILAVIELKLEFDNNVSFASNSCRIQISN